MKRKGETVWSNGGEKTGGEGEERREEMREAVDSG